MRPLFLCVLLVSGKSFRCRSHDQSRFDGLFYLSFFLSFSLTMVSVIINLQQHKNIKINVYYDISLTEFI